MTVVAVVSVVVVTIVVAVTGRRPVVAIPVVARRSRHLGLDGLALGLELGLDLCLDKFLSGSFAVRGWEDESASRPCFT